MERQRTGDIQRNREIHDLLDQIEVPEESMSDLSSMVSGRSNYEPESQVYARTPNSPPRQLEEYFDNSINSSIALHTSPIDNVKLPFEEESRDNSNYSQHHSQAFTSQQVSRMMDWSKSHITPTEGIFPQVSAPSMSIDQDQDMWDESAADSSMVQHMRSRTSFEKEQKRSDSSHGLPVLDLPTHEEMPSREVITFSPGNQDQNWYFNPGTIISKRSSTNHSFRTYQRSSLSTELVAQGSALLANAGNHHFASEYSLAQARDNAVICDEMQKLKNELVNIKIALRTEQDLHENTKKELYDCSNYLQQLEAEKSDSEQRKAELEEHLKMIQAKTKDNSSLDQLRGKALEYARIEIKQLKTYLSERDKKIQDLAHALSQKNMIESNTAREKEIEELTSELAKMKILNSTQNKRIQDLIEKKEESSKSNDKYKNELMAKSESYQSKIKNLTSQVDELANIIKEKNEEIEQLENELNAAKDEIKEANQIKMSEFEDIQNAKIMIETLQSQLNDVQAGRTGAADYDSQLAKIKSSYEEKLSAAQKETQQYKKKTSNLEERVKGFEVQIERLMKGEKKEISIDESEAKETVAIMQAEIEKLQTEIAELTDKVTDLKNAERQLNEERFAITREREELIQQIKDDKAKRKEDLRNTEKMQLDHNKAIRKIEVELQQSKDLNRQYKEEMESLRFARDQAEKLVDTYKKQLDDSKVGTSREFKVNKEKARDTEKEIAKLKSTIKSMNAQFEEEKEELLYQIEDYGKKIQELEDEIRAYPDPEKLEYEIRKECEEKAAQNLKKLKESWEAERTEFLRKNQRSTQTSFDIASFKEEIKHQLEVEYVDKMNKKQQLLEDKWKKECTQNLQPQLEKEIKEKFEKKFASAKQMLEDSYQKRVDELSEDYVKRVKSLESEYEKNANNMEEDFRKKLMSIESDYNLNLKTIREQKEANQNVYDEAKEELQNVKESYEEKIKNMANKTRELEGELKNKEKILRAQYEAEMNMKLNEMERVLKNKKEEAEEKLNKEKSELINGFETERNDYEKQISQLKSDYKKALDQLKNYKNLEKDFLSKDEILENKLEEVEKEYQSKIEEMQRNFERENLENSKAFTQKLKDREKLLFKEYEDKIHEIHQELDKQLEIERVRHNELMNLKEQNTKAEVQRAQEELLQNFKDKEREWEEKLQKQKLQYEREIRAKDIKIEDLSELNSLETNKIREEIKEEFKLKIKKMKEEFAKQKRDMESDVRKSKEASHNALELAKKDLERFESEKLDQERKEWDKKLQQKINILTSKHQKELQDKETLIRLEFEKEKSDSLKQLSHQLKMKFKKREDDYKKYFEELKQAAIEDKAHEIEIQVKKETQEYYKKIMDRLKSKHAQEKEKIIEETERKLEEMRENYKNDPSINSSYSDMPFVYNKKRISFGQENCNDKEILSSQVRLFSNRMNMIIEDLRSREIEKISAAEPTQFFKVGLLRIPGI
ncbi:unnamed protein product [Blepharisma stoltei]|uniref:Uncharacterized protein n=1 Tax=Blepharisma stoltei TaxID=1481888 RepID=A0AAU9IU06_9CILI|nr:unnamed protein product [Blepharisma stoltei]